MKSYSNCSNAGEINIDLPNLFSSKLCLSPSNDHINNLQGYGDFAEENKQYDRVNAWFTYHLYSSMHLRTFYKQVNFIIKKSWR